MLGLEDSDDDTFSASSFGDSTGNRLGSLFGQSDAKSQASLKYTQKKQPSLTTSSLSNHQAASQQPPPAPTVLHATAVHLYQYQSQTGKFEPVGKVGCAVLGTPANNGASATYQLLCYRATKDYVCQATIPTNFSFTIQNGQYGSFYDNNQQLWSLLFQTPDEAFHFGIFVAIAKYATQINTVSQNSMEISSVNMNEQATASALTENDEDAVRVGSRVAVKYTGWLLSAESAVNYKLGKSFDSNASSDKLFRFKVDAGEVIKGWDKGLIGMKAGGRRFLVIPPSLAYGEAGRPPVIPQNAALCFQIEVVKVRNSSSSSTASSSGSISPQIQPTIVTKLHAEQPIVSQKQVSSKKRMKNKLQAFGTPSPFMIGNYMVNNNDDSGDDEDILSTASSDHSSSHMSVSSPVVQHQVTTPTIQPVQPVQPAQPVQPTVEQTVKVDPQMELLQQQIASLQAMLQQSSKPSTPQADSAESESKSKKKKKYRKKKQDSSSSEASDEEPVAADSKKETIKASTPTVDSDQVAKLMERLEFISAKVEDIHQVQAKQFRSELEDDEHKNEKLMSGTVLIANLQHVLQQNDQLKLEIAAERDNVDSLVEKVSQLRKRNEKYAKESYQSAQEQENEHLVSQLDLAKKQLTDLKRKCKRLEDQVETERETASQTQSEHDNQIKQLKKQLEEAKVQAREREVQLQNDFLEQKKNYEEQIKQYSHESQNSEVERSQREQQLQTLLQQTQTKLSNTSSELLKVQSELTHVQGELQERDSSLLQKQSRINLLETKNASLAKRVDDLESESGEVSDQVRESEKNISNLSRQLEQLKTALQEKHAELLESQEELSQANEQHEETLGNLREAFKSHLQEYQTTQLQESVSETLQQALRWMVRNVYSTMKDSALQGQVEKRYKGQKILSALAGVLKHYMVLLIENVDEGVDIDEIEVEQPESVELSDDEGEQSGQEEENIEEAAEEAEEPVSQAVDQQEEVEQEAVESIEQEEEPEQEETEQEVEPIEQEHVVEDEEEEVPEETQEQEDQITEDDLAQPETVEQPEEQPEDEGIEAAEEAEVEEQEIGESAHEQEDEEQEEKEEIGEEHAENEEEQQPVESSISLEQDEEEVEHTNEEENVPSDVNASEEVYSEEEQHVEQEESTVGVEDDTNQYTEDIESEPVDSAVEESPLKNDEDESIPVESQQNVVGGFAFGLRALLLSKPQEDENEQGEEKEVEEDNVQDETNEPSPREEQQPNEEEDRDEINEEEENYSNEEVDNDATPSEEHNNEEIVSEEAANEEIVSEEQEEQETDLNNEPEQSQPLSISTEVITPQTNNTSKPNTPSKLFSYSDDEDDIPVPFAPKVVEPTAEDLQKQEQLQKAKKASTSKLFMDDDDDFW